MTAIIPATYRNLVEFSRVIRDNERKAFLLEIGGEALGRLYLTQENCTLVWNGSLKFDQLEEEVLSDLAPRVGISIDVNKDVDRRKIKVILIRPEKQERYDLGKALDYERYKQSISTASELLFAQFNIYDPGQKPALRYSIQADNSAQLPAGYSELALRLPKLQAWSVEIIEWVVTHHFAKAMKIDQVATSAILKVIEELRCENARSKDDEIKAETPRNQHSPRQYDLEVATP